MAPRQEAQSKDARARSRDDDDEDYDGYDKEMKNRNKESGGSCCSCTKFLIFVLFLGASVGVVFGFVDIEQIENLFSGGSNSGSGGGDSGDGGNSGGTDEPAFSFMQCPDNGDPCCNGLQSNCDLKVNEIMFATVHNANHDDILVPNHEAALEGALEVGYRGLMLDVCLCPNEEDEMEITFCHSICGVGPRDPSEVFSNINQFLTDNPTEVIVINFEMSSGDPTPAEIWDVMKTNEGLRQKAYNHDGGAWPTMSGLLAEGKQLVVFEHNHPEDCVDPSKPGCVARIEPWFTYVVETEFDFNNVAAIESYSSSCAENRGVLGLKDFYAVNHFGKEQ
jgi:hypothetical protein|eukprot:scaffold10220_cov272-Chaetoceros_neogracile.AAC.31